MSIKAIQIVIFDFDGVLTENTQIIELAKQVGKLTEIIDVIKSAMKNISDASSYHRQAIKLLKGLSYESATLVGQRLIPTLGAEEMSKKLNSSGIQTAIITNGYSVTAQPIQQRLSVSRLYANELVFKEGIATGEMIEQVVDDKAKAGVLRKLLDELQIDKNKCAVVGDAMNDIPLFEQAGLSIAFNAEASLRPMVDVFVEEKDLNKVADIILAF